MKIEENKKIQNQPKIPYKKSIFRDSVIKENFGKKSKFIPKTQIDLYKKEPLPTKHYLSRQSISSENSIEILPNQRSKSSRRTEEVPFKTP